MAKVDVVISILNLDQLPEEPGVYVIHSVNQSVYDSMDCKYVGETKNLRERMKQHFMETEQNQQLKSYLTQKAQVKLNYMTTVGSTDEYRLQKEKEWIELYKPQYNIKNNP